MQQPAWPPPRQSKGRSVPRPFPRSDELPQPSKPLSDGSASDIGDDTAAERTLQERYDGVPVASAVEVAATAEPVAGGGGPGYVAMPSGKGVFADASYVIERQDLVLEAEIGQGFFGTVHRGHWHGQRVAVKILRDNVREGEEANFRRETDMLKQLRHPNVLTFYGVTLPPKAMIVSELMATSLFNAVHHSQGVMSPELQIRIARDVAAGLLYLHRRSPPVLHRDLSSANVLLTGQLEELVARAANMDIPVAKLSDFGLSRQQEWYMTASIGNLMYTSPEAYQGEHYGPPADMYSFAITMWEMCARQRPFAEFNPQKAAFMACVKGIRPDMPADAPTVLQTVVARCWDALPDRRPEAGEVVSLLNNPPPDEPQPAPSEQPAALYESFVAMPGINGHRFRTLQSTLTSFIYRRPGLAALVSKGVIHPSSVLHHADGSTFPRPSLSYVQDDEHGRETEGVESPSVQLPPLLAQPYSPGFDNVYGEVFRGPGGGAEGAAGLQGSLEPLRSLQNEYRVKGRGSREEELG